MLETAMVLLARHGEPGVTRFHAFVEAAGIQIVGFLPEHVALALDAFHRFGKGRHPAALNFGDCQSFALARATGERLLFKGEDFSKTDIAAAV